MALWSDLLKRLFRRVPHLRVAARDMNGRQNAIAAGLRALAAIGSESDGWVDIQFVDLPKCWAQVAVQRGEYLLVIADTYITRPLEDALADRVPAILAEIEERGTTGQSQDFGIRADNAVDAATAIAWLIQELMPEASRRETIITLDGI